MLIVDKVSRKIKGASITNYLLEKSRVNTQGENERNFHIFYHFIKGADPGFLEQFGMSKGGKKIDFKEYEYLKKSNCFSVPTINDEQLYQEVKHSMGVSELLRSSYESELFKLSYESEALNYFMKVKHGIVTIGEVF